MLFCCKYVDSLFKYSDIAQVKVADGLFFSIYAGHKLKLRIISRNCIAEIFSGFFNPFVKVTGFIDGCAFLPGKTN